MASYSPLDAQQSPLNFFVSGGTLGRDALSYVTRQADNDLYEGLTRGQFCYVLTSRQMGKSSLMVRTAARLREAGTGVVLLDLTAIGQNLTAEQWYSGLLTQIGQQLDLDDELEDFWDAHPKLGPLQRWMQAIQRVLLPHYPGPLVIFVDEIDAVRSLPFSTDEFFAAIREFYNRRTEDEELRRLTFCLLGVASPSDLIRDTRTTPFNVGQRIELHDFTEAEAAPLAEGLRQSADTGAQLLKRILYWTNGHPYLTQRLCQAIAEEAEKATTDEVDRLCRELFLTHKAQERDDNLLFVRERLLRSEVDLAGLLTLYDGVLANKRVPDEVTSPLNTTLRLSGITRAENGFLKVRNRIYEQVFGRKWVRENMPDAEVRRQRIAYRRGLFRAVAIALVIIAAVASLAIVAVRQRNRARQQEQTNRRQLYAAHMNLAAQEWDQANIGRVQELVNKQWPLEGQEDLRGFEWYYFWRLCHSDLFTVPQELISGVKFSPDGKKLITAGKNLNTWDAATGRKLTTFKGKGCECFGNSMAISPNGKTLVTGKQLWNLDTEEELTTLQYNGDIWSATFSPDGKILVTGGKDSTVKLWDASSGQEIRTFMGHTGGVNSVAFSPDGKRLVSGSDDQTVRLWNVGTGTLLATLKDFGHPVKIVDLVTGDTVNDQVKFKVGDISSIAFSPDGSSILAAGGKILGLVMWDVSTGQVIRQFNEHPDYIRSIAFSPDGKRMATGGNARLVKLWDVATWQVLATIKAQGSPVTAVAFSPDGKKLATTGGVRDGVAKVWDIDSVQKVTSLYHDAIVSSVAFSPDGKKLISASGDRKIKLWDTITGEEMSVLNGHTKTVRSAVFSPDGKIVASGGEDRTLRLWEVATGRELNKINAHAEIISSVAFSPDGKKLASGSWDQTVGIWDVATGHELARLKGRESDFLSMVLSPDGKILAAGGNDGNVWLWDAATGQELGVLPGHQDRILSVTFSADSKKLASAGYDDRRIKVWEIASKKELASIEGQGYIFSLSFSPDGRRLASGSGDRNVKFWDVDKAQELTTLKMGSYGVWSLAFSPDGNTLALGLTSGAVKLLRAATEQEVQARRK